jgi:aquaporin NIP
MKKCGAEFIGTFALVFAGTGAIIINETTGGAITHVGISLTFGLVVLAMICGASMNPARSLAPAVVSQHLSSLWIYMFAPTAGALVAVVGCRCVREEDCCPSRSPAGRSK